MMTARTARRLRRLVYDHRARRNMFRKYGEIGRIVIIESDLRGYQYGLELADRARPIGYCRTHQHRSIERALRCGRRYENGIPKWKVWQ